jgi:hypothetical protein
MIRRKTMKFISDLEMVRMPYLPEITKAALNLFFGIRVKEPFIIWKDYKRMGIVIEEEYE